MDQQQTPDQEKHHEDQDIEALPRNAVMERPATMKNNRTPPNMSFNRIGQRESIDELLLQSMLARIGLWVSFAISRFEKIRRSVTNCRAIDQAERSAENRSGKVPTCQRITFNRRDNHRNSVRIRRRASSRQINRMQCFQGLRGNTRRAVPQVFSMLS